MRRAVERYLEDPLAHGAAAPPATCVSDRVEESRHRGGTRFHSSPARVEQEVSEAGESYAPSFKKTCYLQDRGLFVPNVPRSQGCVQDFTAMAAYASGGLENSENHDSHDLPSIFAPSHLGVRTALAAETWIDLSMKKTSTAGCSAAVSPPTKSNTARSLAPRR